MSASQPLLPVNVITGFLGVGKTTAIQSLLARKPTHERWAVLVNEFGEIGIDGSLLTSNDNNQANDSQLLIREVAGGCMCCTSGLPMQIALNQLISRARPDRLLIEPTGLGHPEEVLAVLRGPDYAHVLNVQSTITLVDARKLSDTRYTSHDIFNQQLAVADFVAAHKADVYEADEFAALKDYLAENQWQPEAVDTVSQGQIPIDWLYHAVAAEQSADVDAVHSHQGHSHDHADHHGDHNLASRDTNGALVIPECGYLRVDNEGQGYVSTGWVFEPDFIFDYTRLFVVLSGIQAERMKAVFITDQGVLGYNLADGTLTAMPMDDTMDSRVELIGETRDRWQHLEADLLACIIQQP
ncbi:Zinc-binding GTPase YeiR [BD1-7 clade bacterium]|uniref:Zinc-binding GTPase YeiR n=1 Tax=BD1-7 clade bacterium TaxID=2029982 RepID=A0A5S9MUI5_9GAMM|nr:Zinc-binding GTPase YeiR [BD1-7 clade bacterium]CAA0083660.1 Zinc-binding GTPase YeiR [BD1-7 clade bacterium]